MAVAEGLVTVGGVPATKITTMVSVDASVDVSARGRRFVSRGGDKLQAALERFSVEVVGLNCLDAGASTGGFTDCLLQAGAARVIAVDVGYGQLAWGLRNDARVTVLERTNVRDLAVDDLPFAPRLVVADLSFVSLRTALPALSRLNADGGTLIVLVKPQFEVAPDRVGDGGVVRDPGLWRIALEGVAETGRRAGLAVRGAMVSPIIGRSGNVEFLLHLGPGEEEADASIDDAMAEALDR